jgi:hypothetical protein
MREAASENFMVETEDGRKKANGAAVPCFYLYRYYQRREDRKIPVCAGDPASSKPDEGVFG